MLKCIIYYTNCDAALKLGSFFTEAWGQSDVQITFFTGQSSPGLANIYKSVSSYTHVVWNPVKISLKEIYFSLTALLVFFCHFLMPLKT